MCSVGGVGPYTDSQGVQHGRLLVGNSLLWLRWQGPLRGGSMLKCFHKRWQVGALHACSGGEDHGKHHAWVC